MYIFEKEFASKGYCAVCGIDEAGCGPIAGPVYAAAVILNPNYTIPGIDDSKRLSEKRREALYPEIIAHSRAYAIASVSEAEIDEINILEARMLAMRKAVELLKIKPDFAIVDGNRDPNLDVQTLCVVKGDAKSASVAAASILAKVDRDHKMTELAKLYPEYQFDVHKGYPTKMHIELLLKYGACPIHRKTFLKKIYERECK